MPFSSSALIPSSIVRIWQRQATWCRVLVLLLVPLLLFFPGCAKTYKVDERRAPLVEAGPSFSLSVNEMGKANDKWWLAINDPLLDDFITEALDDNFTMKEAYARIKQSAATRRQAGAFLKPELTGEVSEEVEWHREGKRTDLLTLEANLSWEVDLWNRLSSAEKAAALENEATLDDLAGAALFLSSLVADTYFQLIEQRSQLALLNHQIEISETFLKLVKLRFAYGKASLVDVHQQRQQVASLQSQLPIVRYRLVVLNNRLHLLLGDVPTKERIQSSNRLPELPPLPKLGIPADLLINRPDLRCLHKQLIIADYRVA